MKAKLMLFACLAACAEFPELDDTVTPAARQADYPTLTRVETILASTGTSTAADAALTARIEALRARAERLRQTDIGALQ